MITETNYILKRSPVKENGANDDVPYIQIVLRDKFLIFFIRSHGQVMQFTLNYILSYKRIFFALGYLIVCVSIGHNKFGFS